LTVICLGWAHARFQVSNAYFQLLATQANGNTVLFLVMLRLLLQRVACACICACVFAGCRAMCAAVSAINNPLRLSSISQACSLLLIINAPQDFSVAEVRQA